jgi:hypothetical protein
VATSGRLAPYANIPNPFAEQTQIGFYLPNDGLARFKLRQNMCIKLDTPSYCAAIPAYDAFWPKKRAQLRLIKFPVCFFAAWSRLPSTRPINHTNRFF